MIFPRARVLEIAESGGVGDPKTSFGTDATDQLIKIKKPDNLYSLLRTPKKSRKPIKNIVLKIMLG